jgi:hypothetical protein
MCTSSPIANTAILAVGGALTGGALAAFAPALASGAGIASIGAGASSAFAGGSFVAASAIGGAVLGGGVGLLASSSIGKLAPVGAMPQEFSPQRLGKSTDRRQSLLPQSQTSSLKPEPAYNWLPKWHQIKLHESNTTSLRQTGNPS